MTGEEHEEALEKEEVGVVPLGIPLFAGPGAITTVMIYISFATTSNDVVFDLSAIFLSIIITVIASYILLRYAEPIFSRMGKSGAGAFTRIMGLLLAAIAIEFIITGTFSAIDSYTISFPRNVAGRRLLTGSDTRISVRQWSWQRSG